MNPKVHHHYLWFLVCSILCLAWSPSGVEVTIYNRSSEALADVVLQYGNEEFPLGELVQDGQLKVRIKATNNANLDLRFRRREGELCVRRVDVYLEEGYKGAFAIYIREDFSLRLDGQFSIK